MTEGELLAVLRRYEGVEGVEESPEAVAAAILDASERAARHRWSASAMLGAMLAMLAVTDQCHGCFKEAPEWESQKYALDSVADYLDIPAERRWWR